MDAAITGETLAVTLLPGQGIGREQALRDAGPWTTPGPVFQDAQRGSIQVGKLADLTLLSDDLLTCAESRIPDITVLMTMLGGHVVYER